MCHIGLLFSICTAKTVVCEPEEGNGTDSEVKVANNASDGIQPKEGTDSGIDEGTGR